MEGTLLRRVQRLTLGQKGARVHSLSLKFFGVDGATDCAQNGSAQRVFEPRRQILGISGL